MADIAARLGEIVGAAHVLTGDAIGDDYTHDEALTVDAAAGRRPSCGPARTDEVAAVLALADRAPASRSPPAARGTGLSGACVPRADGIVVSFERMNRDPRDRHREPRRGRAARASRSTSSTRRLAPHGLVYPVFPGEYSASLGGNVATNAGGMRAVKYGVTRHQVLGLEAVLPHRRGDPHRRQVREGHAPATTSPSSSSAPRARSRSSPRRRCKLYPRLDAPAHGARAVPHARRGHRARSRGSSAAASAR